MKKHAIKVFALSLLSVVLFATVGCKTSLVKSGALKIHILNIGQGDGIFVELPNGKTMMIDGGSAASDDNSCAKNSANCANKFIYRIKPYIDALGYDTIDYFIGSHPHSDHIGSAAAITRGYKIKNAYIPFYPRPGSLLQSWATALAEQGVSLKPLYSGLTVFEDAEHDLSLKILSPNCPDTASATADANGNFSKGCLVPRLGNWENQPLEDFANPYSALMMLEYGSTRALFTGDASNLTWIEARDLYGTEALKTTLLKLAHHGTTDAGSNSARWFQDSMPQYIVASAGYGNTYGHPNLSVELTFATETGNPVKNFFRTDYGEFVGEKHYLGVVCGASQSKMECAYKKN